MEMDSIKEICVVVFLGVNSWIDIRKRQVSLLLIGIFTVCGVIWTIYGKESVLDVLLCAGTGLIVVGVSILTEGAVGMGDGWLIMALGTVVGPAEFFTMIFTAFMCSAIYAGVMLMIFRKKGYTEIPFVPLLLLGYLGGILI